MGWFQSQKRLRSSSEVDDWKARDPEIEQKRGRMEGPESYHEECLVGVEHLLVAEVHAGGGPPGRDGWIVLATSSNAI